MQRQQQDAQCASTGRGMWWCADGSPSAPPDTRALPPGVAGEFRADGGYSPAAAPPPASASAAAGRAAPPRPQCLYDAYGSRTCAR